MSVRSFSSIAARFASRNRQPKLEGKIASINAAAQPEEISGIQAAGVRGFASPAGKLMYVRAKEHFHVTKDDVVAPGDIVQLQELDAKALLHSGRAESVSDEEVAKAQQPAKAGK